MSVARRLVLGALAVEGLVLLGTGIALFFLYRPSASQAWAGVDAASDDVVGALRSTHRIVSMLTVLTSVGAAIVLASRRPRTLAMVGAFALVVTILAGSFTGYLLPWDQLALWAVTVGTNMSGYRPLLGDDVRFVLIGGTEIGPDTLVRWLVVHALVLPAIAAGVVVAISRRRAPARSPR